MKKTLLGLGIATFFVFGMSSCMKKDYTCTCMGNQQVQRVIIPNATKAQAETICKTGETYTQGQTNAQTCKLD